MNSSRKPIAEAFYYHVRQVHDEIDSEWNSALIYVTVVGEVRHSNHSEERNEERILGNLCQFVVTALLLCLAAVGRSDPGGQPPKVWFSMGAISSPAGHHSWEALFYQPDGAWPPFMEHVLAVGILTQALVKIPVADLAKVAARLKETSGIGSREAT